MSHCCADPRRLVLEWICHDSGVKLASDIQSKAMPSHEPGSSVLNTQVDWCLGSVDWMTSLQYHCSLDPPPHLNVVTSFRTLVSSWLIKLLRLRLTQLIKVGSWTDLNTSRNHDTLNHLNPVCSHTIPVCLFKIVLINCIQVRGKGDNYPCILLQTPGYWREKSCHSYCRLQAQCENTSTSSQQCVRRILHPLWRDSHTDGWWGNQSARCRGELVRKPWGVPYIQWEH